MRVFGGNDFSCILVLKDKAVCLFPFFELLSSHSLVHCVMSVFLCLCLHFVQINFSCCQPSSLFLPLFFCPCLCLPVSLSAEPSSSVCLSSVSPYQSLHCLHNLFDCLPAFSVPLAVCLLLSYCAPLGLCLFLFLIFSSHLSDSFFSLFLVFVFFFLSAGYFCILSLFLLCPSFRLWRLCSLCFYCLAQLQKVMGAKCLYSQWQDGPYKSTELIDVMYDTLRDCFDKEVASYCKDTAFDCLCVRVCV